MPSSVHCSQFPPLLHYPDRGSNLRDPLKTRLGRRQLALGGLILQPEEIPAKILSPVSGPRASLVRYSTFTYYRLAKTIEGYDIPTYIVLY
jgi:hypothetical protein